MLPELQLQTMLPHDNSIDEFGHRVHVALLRVGFDFKSLVYAICCKTAHCFFRRCFAPMPTAHLKCCMSKILHFKETLLLKF